MLYLHCGWQRTGTSSLQAALRDRQDQLAEAGIAYPDRWRPEGSNAHYEIAELLEQASAGGGAVRRFQDYLRATDGEAVLMSCEALTNCLPQQKRGQLVALLRAAGEATTVHCLWTLRAMDSLLSSLYLHRLVTNRPLSMPDEFFRAFAGWLGEAPFTMRAAEDAVGGSGVSYVRYASDGGHHDGMLRDAGVPDRLRVEIMDALRQGPRLNTRLGQKGAVVLLHTDAIEARVGAALPRAALRSALHTGELRFAGDPRWELVGTEARHAVHDAVLEASREAGFSPYVEFYGEHEVQVSEPAPLDPDALEGNDIERLREWVEGLAGGGSP